MLQKMILAGLAATALVGATAAQAQALSTDMRASDSQLAPAPAKKAVKKASPTMNGANKADDGNGGPDGTIVAVLAAGAIAGGVIAATSNSDTKVNSPN